MAKVRARTTKICSAVTRHRFHRIGDLSPMQGCVQRHRKKTGSPLALDGDKSPAESADKSTPSKACDRGSGVGCNIGVQLDARILEIYLAALVAAGATGSGGRLRRRAAVAKPSRSSFATRSRWNKFCRVTCFPLAAAGRGRDSRAPPPPTGDVGGNERQPVRAEDNSPAIDRWARVGNQSSPGGTAEVSATFLSPLRGLAQRDRLLPPLKRWAILFRPAGLSFASLAVSVAASVLTTLGLAVMVMVNAWQAENHALPPLASAKPDGQKIFCSIKSFGGRDSRHKGVKIV